MAEIDAILFDLDDTLYPVSTGFSDHRNGEVVCKFMVDYLGFDSMQSAKALRDEYFQRYHSTMKGLNVAMEEGRLPKPFQQEDLGQFWADHCDFARFIHPDPEQFQVIHSLAQVGLKLAVFTNSPRKYALSCLDKLGLRTLFPDDRIFAVEDVLPACKPQPEAFKQVLESIGSCPEKTVIFEDSMKNIRACKALGIRTVLVDEFKGGATGAAAGEAALLHDIPEHADPAVDVVIKDLLEVPTVLPGMWHKRFEAVRPRYMAPEIIRGEGYSGFAADMWALGVVLFALLSGTLPFSAKTEMQLYARIRRGSFTFPDCLGDSQKRLLRGVMRKDATARPSASALLQHAWVAGRDDAGGHLSSAAAATAFMTDSGRASNRPRGCDCA
ncbi:CIPK15 [Symbiodinium sp. CCMP2456]|nr:CIPK15 [Symbiodinium sp. CCMP2456]